MSKPGRAMARTGHMGSGMHGWRGGRRWWGGGGWGGGWGGSGCGSGSCWSYPQQQPIVVVEQQAPASTNDDVKLQIMALQDQIEALYKFIADLATQRAAPGSARAELPMDDQGAEAAGLIDNMKARLQDAYAFVRASPKETGEAVRDSFTRIADELRALRDTLAQIAARQQAEAMQQVQGNGGLLGRGLFR